MPKGFTLIEVLIAITIVGIVFGVIITSGSALQRSSRDTQREVDLRNLQSALQQYYSDQSFYPSAIPLATLDSLTSGTGNPTPPATPKTYLNQIPKEPRTGDPSYCYSAQATKTIQSCENNSVRCHYYLLCAAKEAASSGQAPSAECEAACGSAYNLQVTPIQ